MLVRRGHKSHCPVIFNNSRRIVVEIRGVVSKQGSLLVVENASKQSFREIKEIGTDHESMTEHNQTIRLPVFWIIDIYGYFREIQIFRSILHPEVHPFETVIINDDRFHDEQIIC